MKSNQKSFRHAAFTLIELLVVIAIIALLASIVLVALNGARVKARDAKRIGDITAIGEAIQFYYNDNGSYPNCPPWTYSTDSNWQTIGCLQVALQSYIPVLPKDPLNSVSSSGDPGPWYGAYTYAYGSNSGNNSYDLVGEFEDTTNKDNCANRNWIWHATNFSWCNHYSYSPYLFTDH